MLLSETGSVDRWLGCIVVGFMDIFLKPFGFCRCCGADSTICDRVDQNNDRYGSTRSHTVIFTISPYAKASSFDSGKAEPDSLPKSGCVDMGNPVLVTDPPIREIESLSGHIPVWIRSVVRGQPGESFEM